MMPGGMGAPADQSSAPLADYFFIAGIESSRIFDKPASNGFMSPPLDPTLEEPAPEDPVTPTQTRPLSRNSRETVRRKKRFSYEARKSISSIPGLEKSSASNRSSATIRPIKENGGTVENGESTFDEALRKFVADRDSVLQEIRFSAGQIAQPSKPAPRPKPKTQRIVNEETQLNKSPIGSVRRRLSTMNPLSRPSTSRRCGYSSVLNELT